MQTRRDANRDRAEQAQAFRDLTPSVPTEHAAFVAGMEQQMTAHQTTIEELEVALTSAQRRAAEASRKLNAEAKRADLAEAEGESLARRLDEAETRAAEAILRVAELEAELDVAQAELDAVRVELAAWEAPPTLARVVDGGCRRVATVTLPRSSSCGCLTGLREGVSFAVSAVHRPAGATDAPTTAGACRARPRVCRRSAGAASAQRGPQLLVDAGGGEDADELGAVLDADDRLVVAEHRGQGLLEGGVDVDGAAEVAGGDARRAARGGRGRWG